MSADHALRAHATASHGAGSQTTSTPGKHTHTAQLGAAPADGAGLREQIGTLASDNTMLALAVTALQQPQGGEQAATAAITFAPRVATRAGVLRGAESQLRAASLWSTTEPLLASADQLLKQAWPLITSEFGAHGAAQPSFPPDRRAFYGIELYAVADQSLLDNARVNTSGIAGPRQAGPYAIHAYLGEGGTTLLCFCAFHKQRLQNEWMIGVDKIADFAATADLYAGTAAKAYPGSTNVPESMAGGADGDPHLPSDAELRALHKLTPDAAVTMQDVPDVSNPGGASHGGAALNGARNSMVRLREYEVPARQIAEKVLAKVNSGELNHLTRGSVELSLPE